MLLFVKKNTLRKTETGAAGLFSPVLSYGMSTELLENLAMPQAAVNEQMLKVKSILRMYPRIILQNKYKAVTYQ